MIKFKNVNVKYEKDKYALRDFNLQIDDGEFVFIVGKTGAGKSTIFKLLTQEIKPTSGSIKVFKNKLEFMHVKSIPYYRRNLGIIFQNFRLLPDKNVYNNIAFAQEIIGESSFRIKKRVMKVLNLVGLRNKSRKYPRELSGGEQQKVAIARAIINKPSIILADEPTGNLDEVSSNEIMDLLLHINDTGATVIVITHDLHLVSRLNKRVVRINNGSVISDTIGLDDELLDYINTNDSNYN